MSLMSLMSLMNLMRFAFVYFRYAFLCAALQLKFVLSVCLLLSSSSVFLAMGKKTPDEKKRPAESMDPDEYAGKGI